MKYTISLLALIVATPVSAQSTRQLDAHEHGVGTLNIAIDGSTLAMEFHAPGADIVGFEYAAASEADIAAVDAAIEVLGTPLDLFVMPEAAGCRLIDAAVALETDDDHDHADEASKASHTEFHGEYMLTCDMPSALTQIMFPYFDVFPNAQEVEVRIVTDTGATAFEVERDDPTLEIGS